MIGDIKTVTIGRTYIKDEEGNDTKEVDNPGKDYELIKRGTSVAMSLHSIFSRMIMRARIDLGADIPLNQIFQMASVGLSDELIAEIRAKIILCVSTPKITVESFEDEEKMDFRNPSELLSEIYDFHCGEPDKKKENQGKS